MAHDIAQINASLPLEPLESARLADFVAALEPINALADEAPGFRWRLQTEDGDATAVRLSDERLITFRTPFPSPGGAVVAENDEWFCSA